MKIVDPDQLNQATEIVIATGAKTIQLLSAGNLNDTAPGVTSGVTLQAVYSFLKEEWMTDTALNKFRFPIKAIYEAKFIMVNSWDWADAQTRDLIRDAGWQEVGTNEYATIISLGLMDDDAVDQPYYQNVTGFDQTKIDFDKTGRLNEPIMIYGGSAAVDYRGFLKAFLREELKTSDEYNLLTAQGYAALTFIAYRLPLSNADDASMNATYDDTYIAGNQPFTSMQLQYYPGADYSTASATTYVANDVVLDGASTPRWAICTTGGTIVEPATAYASFGGTSGWIAYPGERQVGTNYYAFNRAIVCDSGNKADTEEFYAFGQYSNRQATDINDDPEVLSAGVYYGNVAVRLCYFVGSTLYSWPGVCFDNYDPNAVNDLSLQDITVDGGGLDSEGVPITSTARTYPFTAAGEMVFNVDLVNDTDAEYWMYFASAGTAIYDSTSATIVNDKSSNPISGTVPTSVIAFDFDYTYNNQGGRTPNTDADVIVVAMGLNGAEWVEASFTITENTGLTFPVNAPTERNFSNPT